MWQLQKMCSRVLLYSLIILLVACTKQTEPSEKQSEAFIKFYGGSATDSITSMAVSDNGNFVLAGRISLQNQNSQASLIITDKFGNETAVSPIALGNGQKSIANAIYKTADGDFLVTGSIETSANEKDMLVAKVSENGQVRWTKTFGGSQNEEGYTVVELSSGNIVVGGYTESIGNGGKDAWVILLDNAGNKIWEKTYGYPDNDICRHILEKGDYLIFTGSTYRFGNWNVFLVKIDKTNGGIAASNTYGGTGNEHGQMALEDAQKNIIVLANRQDTSAFFLIKISDDFYTPLWQKYVPNTPAAFGSCILFNDSNLEIWGSETGSSNAAIMQTLIDTNGEKKSSAKVSTQSGQWCVSASYLPDGKLIIAGNNQTNDVTRAFLCKEVNPFLSNLQR
jgi:hypothetical protein